MSHTWYHHHLPPSAGGFLLSFIISSRRFPLFTVSMIIPRLILIEALISNQPIECFVFCEEMSKEENPRVFLDISINGRPAAERIEIELFANVMSKTAENFRSLCTGERGIGSITGRPLHYKGTVFHLIRKGFLAQGGDISEEQNGKGGESIYGGYFPNENFQLSHSVPGMLSMAHGDRKGNGTRHHVVFGMVIEGMGTLFKINQLGTPGGEPTGLVQITDCGEIKNNVMRVS
ncbi:hypothetical protein L1987_45582 [Smallanthus sonchifolius]|uniref:Uncharacterized protein n=1 Tax=Smallanthus sonchifolius TaxID=185202 RepID=A0ACB9FY04_9ASTR|nr:hypothetical protein L1987_45582 [Smallanthus sonchifolius]